MNASLAGQQDFAKTSPTEAGTTDPLRAARGVVFGCAIGATLWAGIIAAIFA